MEFEFHHSILLPAQARLSTSTQLAMVAFGSREPGSLLGCRTGSALHQPCPGMLSLAVPPAPALGWAVLCELCHDPKPQHFSTEHQNLPRAPARACTWD